MAKRLGYKSFDYALPQPFFDRVLRQLIEDEAECTHPYGHFVWVYEDKTGSCGLGGLPGPLTSVGRNMIRAWDKRDEQMEPVSPSLSGLHE